MAAKKSTFVCENCGEHHLQWYGRCPSCNAWNSVVENTDPSKRSGGIKAAQTIKASQAATIYNKMHTAIGEFDDVLNGGFVPGQTILLTGEPGIGKSSLVVQVCAAYPSYYIAGEESVNQITARLDRLKLQKNAFTFTEETNIEAIRESLDIHKDSFRLIIVDSIQTVWSRESSGAAGTVGQINACTHALIEFAKEHDKVVIIVGHVTKSGDIAGPKTLEHYVDTVVHFEGDKNQGYRILRCKKNRFGTTDEIGIFEMREDGLHQHSSSTLLDDFSPAPGKIIAGTLEGRRALFLEIQTLVVDTKFTNPRRVCVGYDTNKILMLLAVLQKHLAIHLEQKDIYISIMGGVEIKNPLVELGIIASVLSSYRNKPFPATFCFSGEVDLLGRIRTRFRLDNLVKQAAKLPTPQLISAEKVSNVLELFKLL
ncbi:MAG: hypothetical protein UZ21_OP11001000136 [Microgenomates bacterium OLB22]|nr:MAG: hypothetical protein UZ21_OP11001000136 [Microgenomates bacterium OLB22]